MNCNATSLCKTLSGSASLSVKCICYPSYPIISLLSLPILHSASASVGSFVPLSWEGFPCIYTILSILFSYFIYHLIYCLFIYIYLLSFVPIDKKVPGQRFLCMFCMLLYFQHLWCWLGNEGVYVYGTHTLRGK